MNIPTQSVFYELDQNLNRYWSIYNKINPKVLAQASDINHFIQNNLNKSGLESLDLLNPRLTKVLSILDEHQQEQNPQNPVRDLFLALNTKQLLAKITSEVFQPIVQDDQAKNQNLQTMSMALSTPHQQLAWVDIKISKTYEDSAQGTNTKSKSIDLDFYDELLGVFTVSLQFPRGFYDPLCNSEIYVENIKTYYLFEKHLPQLEHHLKKTGLQIESIKIEQKNLQPAPKDNTNPFSFHEEA